MKTNAINNMRTFRSKLTVAALAALFTLVARAGAAPTCGLTFNGTSAYVDTSTGVIPGSGDFTVEFWAACPTALWTYKEILSQGSSGNALYIGTDLADNIRLGDSWGTSVAFPVGGWHHFAVVKSSTNSIFYLDGANVLARGAPMANPAASTGLRFGRQYDDDGEYWPGSIGDVRIWSRVLSDAEIAASLTNQLTGSEANLVANWQFQEGAGTTCTSIGPAPVVGTLINGPVWIVPPPPPAVFALGTTNLTEGPVAGSDSVVLVVSQASASWTATANDAWLQVTTASGAGSTNVVFTFDANPGAARSGTLTVAGQTVTITQAGAGFVLAASVTTLVSSGLNEPFGVAADGAGNVYIADTVDGAVKKWNVANGNPTTLADSSSGLLSPEGVAVDGAGNVYIADTGNSAVKKWNVANGNLTTLADWSSGLYYPHGVAVDGAGNVYIADTYNSAVKKWNVANGNLTTLADSSSGLLGPEGVALDGAGNVYIADTYNNAIKEWSVASSNVTTLVSSGLNQPGGLAVDGAGNVYIADTYDSAIKVWNAASGTVSTLVSSGLNTPFGVAVDGAGDVYIADTINNAIEELPRIFANSAAFTAEVAGPAADTNSIMLSVCPANARWLATANDSWLHLFTASGTGSTNFRFTFDANPGDTRTGTLTVAGQTLTITQAGAAYVLAAPLTTLVSSGLCYPSGVAADGAGNVYIADTGNNAIKVWNAASGTVSSLVSSGLNEPLGVAVDGAGNVYIADTQNWSVKKWNPITQAMTDLADGILCADVAVDGAGNVYIADIYNSAIREWNVASGNVTTLADSSSGLWYPCGVAADGAGNVYIANTGYSAVEEWNVANGNLTTLADSSSGLSGPFGVAVDGAGNVYIADTYNNAIKVWNAASGTVSTLVSSGLNSPCGVAVDGAGNVYIADTYNSAVEKWNAANSNLTTLADSSSGLNYPQGVAVDGAGNVYIADTGNSAIEELPCAFVCTNSVAEGATAGSDALPAVLPAGENLSGIFAPSSDQPWLTITSVANGVVSFSFTANTGAAPRTANITLLGQTIPVTQSAAPLPPAIANWTFNASTQVQLQFTGSSHCAYTVLTTTNVALPLSSWVPLNTMIETSPGHYQCTDTNAPCGSQRFYAVRGP
jgi:sugar lactone lactonase YvrE